MKKVWKIVVVVALIILLLGAVCIGVGFLTGAQVDRTMTIVLNKYNLTPESATILLEQCKETVRQVMIILWDGVKELINSIF